MKLKYSLSKVDGNAHAIIGYVCGCMKKEKKSKSEIERFVISATSSDHKHLISASLCMIDKLNKE